ncbi:Mitochondrial ribosomal protein s18 [Mycena kentingensis (nom. inval.)]|nr:Mitochondrial ribosomal protein s18 [Mycena kentingensis (nom. inval.)]
MLRRFFATTALRRNDSANEALGKVADILTDASKDQELDEYDDYEEPKYKLFRPGDFIRPWDLSLKGRSFNESPRTRRVAVAPGARESRKNDVFHQLGIDPLKYAQHPKILFPFMSEMAMILPRRTTGLTSRSQRRVAKAIRRAKMMGLIPLHSRPSRS